VFRGDRLPADLRGDLFITEPVGRLVHRARIVTREGLTQLRNTNPGSEFLLGTDPLFRPVNLKVGPDGVLYVADMYHGIIQEATWVGPGSYLRRKVEQYQLDKIIDYGRVWRLRYDGTEAIEETTASGSAPQGAAVPATPALALDSRPRMLEETPAELVAHLAHPNGWWRDMAQRLLVLRQDRSVVPALTAMARRAEAKGEGGARRSDDVLGRFHAIWTLEGLGALDAALVRDLLRDSEPRVRVQALRASETLYKAGDVTLAADYRAAAKDSTPDVAIQAMLTMSHLKVPDAADVIRTTMAGDRSRGVQLIGALLLTPAPAPPTNPSWTPEQRQMLQRGDGIYKEICSQCHGDDGRGTPVAGGAPGTTMAPPLAGSPRVQGHRDYVADALLHGLTGPIDGRTYTQVMIPMGTQDDDWIASVGSYVRSSFGNDAPLLSAADVARVRLASARRKTSWTVAEIASSLPVPLDPAPTWRVTASHNSATAGAGLTLAGWTSGQPQQAGMWYQVELPNPVMIAEVQFDSAGGGPLGRAVRAGGPGTTGYARQYEVRVSLDGRTWGTPVATGQGTPLTIAAFRPVRGRFVRVTQTGTGAGAPPWVVQSFRISVAREGN
jgi:mono/diheme cytochrome c family protein